MKDNKISEVRAVLLFTYIVAHCKGHYKYPSNLHCFFKIKALLPMLYVFMIFIQLLNMCPIASS